MAKKDTADNQQTMTILHHLEELRKVIIVSVVAVLVAGIISFVFIEQILAVITRPLEAQDINLVVTAITEGIFIKFKIAILAGTILAAPIIIWQIWRFIVPALYPHEKRYLTILIPVSVFLFISGVLFAYFTVFPLAVFVLIQLASEFEPMLTVSKYLSFTLAFLIPFGLVFELPLVVYFLTSIGVITPEWLQRNRKYAIVIIVILAAVLTPGPDPISQMIMAAPMVILYEAGVLVSKVVMKKRRKRQEAAGEEC